MGWLECSDFLDRGPPGASGLDLFPSTNALDIHDLSPTSLNPRPPTVPGPSSVALPLEGEPESGWA